MVQLRQSIHHFLVPEVTAYHSMTYTSGVSQIQYSPVLSDTASIAGKLDPADSLGLLYHKQAALRIELETPRAGQVVSDNLDAKTRRHRRSRILRSNSARASAGRSRLCMGGVGNRKQGC